MDEKVLKQIGDTVAEAVRPVGEKLGLVEAAVARLGERVGVLEARREPGAAVRLDANGKQVGAPVEVAGEAPAHLRTVNKHSSPLLISNVWRAVMMGGQANRATLGEYAPEELDFSSRLRKAGYSPVSAGGLLFPLGEELLLEPVDEKGKPMADFSALRKEVSERIRLVTDPSELAWTIKRFPDLHRAMGVQQKDLQLGDDTLGAYLIPFTQADRVIDLLRNRLSVMRAGATEIPLPPSGNITYPRLTADPAFAWADPDTTADAATSNVNLGVVRLLAKSLRGFVTIPNDLLRYASPSVEVLVRSALAARAAIAEDSAYLEGAGSTLQPRGLINYGQSSAEVPAVGKLTLHVATTAATNGDTFEPEDVLKTTGLYYLGNDPDAPTAWIMRPLMWTAIANRRADAVTAGDKKGPFMFWTSRGQVGDAVPERLGGVPVVQTPQASANRAKGSGTTLVYTLFGNFRRMIIGRVGVLELAVSEHVKFLQDKTLIRAVLRSDMGLEHEESFVFTDTLLES